MRNYAIFLFILFFGLCQTSTAQQLNTLPAQRLITIDLPPGHNKIITTEPEKGIEGSPWLDDNWSPGTIFLTNGKIITGLKYRYNVYRNLLYFQLRNVEYEIGSPDSIAQLLMNGRKYVYDNTEPSVQHNKRFMEVAVDGNAILYVNYYPVVLPPNFNNAFESGNRNTIISIKEAYLIKAGKKLTVLDKKGKLLPVALAPKAQEINAFMKKEKISPISRADVEKVVRYYNSLK